MNKKEPIRVLQCVSNMDRAGIETMLMNFYRNIDRDSIQFDFLCNKSKPGDYDDEIRSLGGNIYVTPGLSPFKWFKYQRYMKQLFIAHPEYKIIHCQNEAMGFPALYAAKKAGIPVRIAHSHNTVTRFDFKWPIKILYKFLIKYVATDLVACSHAAGKYLFGKDVKVINNAINGEKFLYNEKIRNTLRNELNLVDKFVIGHVGRFEPQKNHKFLINLFYEYQKLNDKAYLLLIGNGSLEDDIKELVNTLNLNDKVLFMGNISNVNDLYQVMDVFVLPSFHEGLPVVGVEAQFADLPCIFSSSITGEVQLSNDVSFIDLSTELWIEKLQSLFSSKKNRNSVNYMDYNIKNVKDDLVDYYMSLLGGIKSDKE